MKTTNIVSVSGGKDSTATLLLAIEQGAENLQCVFADTGHEHAETYKYLDYLDTHLPVQITRVMADFSSKFAKKRQFIADHWEEDGVPPERVARALEVLYPTGNPFLDLCLWKGRFPSTKRRFCSEELKHKPIQTQVVEPALEEYERVVSWQGIRADESPSRAKLPMTEMDFGDEDSGSGLWVYRPILRWTAEEVFAFHDKHGIEPNPLYKQGMGRVGCMPCIHATKPEMHQIAMRFPEEIARVAEWEALVSDASKRGCSTFMDARVTAKMLGTGKMPADMDIKTHGISGYVEWARSARGGRQVDLIKAIDIASDIPVCHSVYGLCE